MNPKPRRTRANDADSIDVERPAANKYKYAARGRIEPIIV